MNKHLVSVIVPVYKVEAYIEKCIRSLFEQTYENIEFIFVDDASPDNSIEIIKDVLKSYPKREDQTQIISHEINKGLPSARNTGLANAKGEYIYHCDSDDWVDIQIIEKLLQKAIFDNADVVFCDIYNVYKNEMSVFKQSKCNNYIDYINDFFTGYSQGSVCNKLIRAVLYFKNNITFPENASYLEDLHTVVQLYYFANKISYLPEPLYYYVKFRGDSITGVSSQKNDNIDNSRVINVKGIEQFLINKKLIGFEKSLNLLKLGSKQNLLVNAKSLNALYKWKEIFPESNGFVNESHLPFYYKILCNSINANMWFVPWIWIQLKRLK